MANDRCIHMVPYSEHCPVCSEPDRTTEDTSQTDLEGEQLSDGRVDAADEASHGDGMSGILGTAFGNCGG